MPGWDECLASWPLLLCRRMGGRSAAGAAPLSVATYPLDFTGKAVDFDLSGLRARF